jgi:hypothetical protein
MKQGDDTLTARQETYQPSAFRVRVEKVVSFLAPIVIPFIGFLVCIHVASPHSWILYLALGLSVAFLLFASADLSICFFLFLLPLMNLFRLDGSSTSWVTFLFLAFIPIYFIKNLGRPFNGGIFLPIFLYAVYFVLMMIAHYRYPEEATLRNDISILFYMALPFLFFSFKKAQNFNDSLLLYLGIGFVMSSLFCAFFTYYSEPLRLALQSLTHTPLDKYDFGGIELWRCCGSFSDPNYYSFYGLSVAALCYSFAPKSKLAHIECYVLSILCLFLSLLSASKMFLIVSVVFLLYVFIAGILKGGKRALIVTIFGIAFVFLLVFYGARIEAAFIERLNIYSGDLLSSLTTSRSMILYSYLKILVSEPLRLFFGSGLHNQGIDLVGYTTHNFFVGSLFHMGIVGSIFFYSYIGTLFRSICPANRKINVGYVIPFLFVFLLCGLALDLETMNESSLLLIAFFLLINGTLLEQGQKGSLSENTNSVRGKPYAI